MSSSNRLSLCRRLPPEVLWVLLVVCCIASPIAYLALDQPVFEWQVQRHSLHTINIAVEAFRLLGKAWLLVWLLLVWIAMTGRWRQPLVALLALLILAVPISSVKVLVGRPRPKEKIAAMQKPPESVTENAELRGHSFPSGDTASTCAVAVALAVALAWPWSVAALLTATGIGVMRVVDLAHHPSDVFTGAAIGIACALAAIHIARHWSPPAIEVWGRKVAIIAAIGMPLVTLFVQQRATALLFFETYVPLVLIVWAIAKARSHVRSQF